MTAPRPAVAHPRQNVLKPLPVNYQALVTDRYTQYTEERKEHLTQQIQAGMAWAAAFDQSRLTPRII